MENKEYLEWEFKLLNNQTSKVTNILAESIRQFTVTAWNHQQEKIDQLQAENKKLKGLLKEAFRLMGVDGTFIIGIEETDRFANRKDVREMVETLKEIKES